jgi:hypothetical protein
MVSGNKNASDVLNANSDKIDWDELSHNSNIFYLDDPFI